MTGGMAGFDKATWDVGTEMTGLLRQVGRGDFQGNQCVKVIAVVGWGHGC